MTTTPAPIPIIPIIDIIETLPKPTLTPFPAAATDEEAAAAPLLTPVPEGLTEEELTPELGSDEEEDEPD